MSASPKQSVLPHLEALAKSAPTEAERLVYRAQWAGAMARFERINTARSELQSLRKLNSSFAPRLTAWILAAEGLVDHFTHNSSEALGRFKRAHAIAAAINDVELRCFAAAWLAAGEFLAGEHASAVAHALEALREPASINPVSHSCGHLVLANVLAEIGLPAEAYTHYTRARHFAVEARDISLQAIALYDMSAQRIAQLSFDDAFGRDVGERVEFAEAELNSVANLSQLLSLRSLGARITKARAQLALVRKEWSEANASYARLAIDAPPHWPEPRTLAEQSHSQAMLNLHQGAQELSQQALASLPARTRQMGAGELAACHARLGLAWSALGEQATADLHTAKATDEVARRSVWQQIQQRDLAPLIGAG